MIYHRRIALPAELTKVADENLAEYWDPMSKKYPAQVLKQDLGGLVAWNFYLNILKLSYV